MFVTHTLTTSKSRTDIMFATAKTNLIYHRFKTRLQEIVETSLTFSLVSNFSTIQSSVTEIQTLSKHINEANAKSCFYRYKSSLKPLLNRTAYVSYALSGKHLQTLAI